MEVTTCDFDLPVEGKRVSTGLHEGMFNQDVGFRFQVNVKVTDRKDVAEMLEVFNKAAADFNAMWKRVLN